MSLNEWRYLPIAPDGQGDQNGSTTGRQRRRITVPRWSTSGRAYGYNGFYTHKSMLWTMQKRVVLFQTTKSSNSNRRMRRTMKVRLNTHQRVPLVLHRCPTCWRPCTCTGRTGASRWWSPWWWCPWTRRRWRSGRCCSAGCWRGWCRPSPKQ